MKSYLKTDYKETKKVKDIFKAIQNRLNFTLVEYLGTCWRHSYYTIDYDGKRWELCINKTGGYYMEEWRQTWTFFNENNKPIRIYYNGELADKYAKESNKTYTMGLEPADKCGPSPSAIADYKGKGRRNSDDMYLPLEVRRI